jgi:hypothetical protein
MISPNEDAELKELTSSGLLDGAWYLREYADVAAHDVDPLIHFHRFGWQEGRKPNPYFDPAWYRRQYPDAEAADINPVLHYIRQGEAAGHRPIGHFDPIWYRTAYALPEAGNALAHFLTRRITGRFAPNVELYAVPYLRPYRDDVAHGEDPFIHFLDDVWRGERDAFPDPAVLTAAGLLDQNYYLINGSDVQEAQLDPVVHFCRFGWREGRKPNIYFDVNWYLQTNPDVARMQINPVVHYAVEGELANRRPVPYFDPGWYRATYRIGASENALAHFLTHRRSQAFSPNPMFDIAWYVQRYADEVGRNRDPFAHYLQAGTYRDFDPSPTFDAEQYRKHYLGRPSRQFRHLIHPEKDNPLVHFLRSQYR